MLKINLGNLAITSAAFDHGERLPDAYAAGGSDQSPPLSWTGVPDGTASFALVVHDPDAPVVSGFTHWVLYDIPAHVASIPEGGGSDFTSGVHSRGEAGWRPVSPPPGHGTHHYFFHLYALDEVLDLPEGLTAEDLVERIDPHVINQARIVGTYSNPA